MKITLKRIPNLVGYTIGRLYVDGKYLCDTIEDQDRNLTKSMSLSEIRSKKVYGETAIPKGDYKISLTYSNKFKRILPLINNVPGYEGVRIHPGNTDKDTLGCILPGYNKVKGRVINSRIAFNKLFNLINRANSNKEDILLEIK